MTDSTTTSCAAGCARPTRPPPSRRPTPRVARLLEDVMSTELTTENRETGTRNRGPLTWLVAAAAVVVIAGVGFLGVRALTGDDDPVARRRRPRRRASPSWTSPAAAGDAASAWSPTPRSLASADVAFDGTVTAIAGDQCDARADAAGTPGSRPTRSR